MKYFTTDAERWDDLYTNPTAQRTLAGIIDAFVRLSEEHDFQPVFLMIPMNKDMFRTREGAVPTYRAFLETARRKHVGRLTIVDVLLQKDIAFERFHVHPYYRGHNSSYGNQVIAEALHSGIVGLLP